MSDRELQFFIVDIHDSLKNIVLFTEGMDFDMYQSDLKTKHAVERNFEMIGEAAARLPLEFKSKNAQIEWRVMKDFRNFIIHEYFGINDQTVWDIIIYKIPDLLLQIQKLS